MDKKYNEIVKTNLLMYKYNPDYRDEYYDKLFSKNKNKLLIAMLELFETEINTFSYNDTSDLTYLFTLLDLLPDILRNNKVLQQTTINRFTSIHRDINEIIHIKPNKMTKEQNNRYKLLKNILFKMEDTILKFHYEIPPDYDPTKGEFISYIIFNTKNLNHFANAIEEFPYIVNIKDSKERPLIQKVLSQYIKALDQYVSNVNLGHIDDLIYYKKVFNALMDSPKIAVNDKDKEYMLNMLRNYVKHKELNVVRQKEKLTYFINVITLKIMGEEEDRSLESLNYEYEVHDNFKASHNIEAKRIYILNKDLTGIRKRRKIYTFDGEGAKELDDALSIEKKDGIYHLGVHIADPTTYIDKSSILYDEAERRTRSLYCGDECIPMYPITLSGDLMSLNEGEYRHAMSHYFDIDERTGELIKYNIKNEIIKVAKNCTYKQFNNDIIHGSDDHNYLDTLLLLCEIAPILSKVYDENSVYQEYHSDNSKTIGTSVVEKCMIYTNYNLARLFAERDLPYMYRCHRIDENVIKEIEDLQSRIKLRSDDKSVLRDLEMIKNIFPKAYYTSKNVGHEGLGTDFYSHVTSPLRRFADNVSTECIYKFILNRYKKDDIKRMKEYIDEVSEEINQKRRTLDAYEIERVHRK